MNPIRTAVITGGHSFDVINFHRLFREMDGVDAYIQHMEDFSAAPEAVRDSYDVIILYTMLQGTPEGRLDDALRHLGSAGQGLVFVHHGLLAYRGWPVWDEMTGLTVRTLDRYAHDEPMAMVVEDTAHPVTAGLTDWSMIDETYVMPDALPENGNHILLTTSHPDCVRTIAWTRQYRRSRVLCLQSGHDNQTWANDCFRQLLRQGILWSSGR